MNDDGTMARVPDLFKIARQRSMAIVTVRDLIEYRMTREKLVQRIVRRSSRRDTARSISPCTGATRTARNTSPL